MSDGVVVIRGVRTFYPMIRLDGQTLAVARLMYALETCFRYRRMDGDG